MTRTHITCDVCKKDIGVCDAYCNEAEFKLNGITVHLELNDVPEELENEDGGFDICVNCMMNIVAVGNRVEE